MKKIGILTSGGDCGGLNAAIRSIFFRAKNKYDMRVIGIKNGTTGFLQRPLDYVELTSETFSGYLLKQGGTFFMQGKEFEIRREENKFRNSKGDYEEAAKPHRDKDWE